MCRDGSWSGGHSLTPPVGQTPDKNQLSRTPREEGSESCQVILSDGANTARVCVRASQRRVLCRQTEGWGGTDARMDGWLSGWTDR